ncbi:hypothetical protein [Sulfobacillus harzensis]|uniref:Uncharacterized protein n=1 Tax=Sulfobacillus harzensis TaxID=2729629 RepID=A0A7Y0L476_9FIRM|nr:hypothetical protein [Sulfobacillus harzensis]NMP23007.1 hypothetical protein [Sulfobacillus harzensis]
MVLVLVAGGLAVTLAHPRASAPLPRLWIFYARSRGNQEILYGREYTAKGKPLEPALKIGPLGLVQQVQVASPGVKHSVWVTLGGAVVALDGHRVATRRPAPDGWTILSVRDISGRLYAIAENVRRNRVSAMIWRQNGWVTLASRLPLAITTLETGSGHSLWALSASPHEAQLIPIGGRPGRVIASVAPQGTVGFSGGHPVLPYATGSNGFGYWTGRRHRFRSVYQAAISVTDTTPLWGLGVNGMVPYRQNRFDWRDAVRWPTRQQTTPTVIAGSGPWVAVLDGFSQGEWFNIQTGRFGPSFQIKTPWWAVVRAASLGS